MWLVSLPDPHNFRSGIQEIPARSTESVATLPPFSPIEGQKWFDQISSQWESQKNRFALIYFGKIEFLPPCIWNLPFMPTASVPASIWEADKPEILFLANQGVDSGGQAETWELVPLLVQVIEDDIIQ